MARMRIDAIGGVGLNVRRTGQGPPVVALHGFSGSMSTWESFIEAAKGEFTIIGVDLPGHGASGSPQDPELYTMESAIAGLKEVLDCLDLERVHWLGYSLGGRIALGAALALPQRTLSLVVESASPGLRAAEERAARVSDDRALADWLERVGVEAFTDYWESLPLWASQARMSAPMRDRLRAQRLSNNAVGLANSLRGIGTGMQPQLYDKLLELAVPAMFVAGEEDAKFTAIAREIHRLASGSVLHTVPGAGHAAHLEQPERFNQAVLDFLRAISPCGEPVTRTSSRSPRSL